MFASITKGSTVYITIPRELNLESLCNTREFDSLSKHTTRWEICLFWLFIRDDDERYEGGQGIDEAKWNSRVLDW